VAIVADSPIKDEFVWTLRNVGVDHLLFGSDYPQYGLAKNLAAFDKLGLTDDEKARIRFANARKLFGLKAD
jgi:predicted TIM-barrel fold metal-dependent hydrolase